jgi:hypothetical protein
VSNIERPVLRKHTIDGEKRLRRVVSLTTAAALSASLIAGAAGTASAAVREPARTATLSVAYSGKGLPAASRMTVARYIYLRDGQLALDTLGAQKAGVSSQTLRTESTLVANLNALLDGNAALANVSRANVLNAIQAVPAAAQGQASTIQLLPGVNLTINSFGIQLSLSKEAVTEVENVAGFGQAIASLVGNILSVIPGTAPGPAIAAIVGSALGIGSSFLKLCTASNGSATFTVPWIWNGLPSCSGLSLVPLEAR